MSTPDLAFSLDEYRRRIDAVRAVMRERGAEIALIDEVEHLGYLTGFTRTGSNYQVCIVPLTGDPAMILRKLDEPTFLESTWLTDYRAYPDYDSPIELLASLLTERGWDRSSIAMEFDSNYLPVRRFHAIQDALPNATFVDFSGVLWEQRLHKSAQEIEYLRRAAAIADEAMLRVVNSVREGISERVAAITASTSLIELGADGDHFGLITSGSRTASLHGSLGDHHLEAGDLLHVELVPKFRGYSARIMRPSVIGTPSDEQAKTAETLRSVQDQQFAAMKPGVPASEIDRICREGILASGLRDSYENTTGYTLGYYGHGAFTPARSSDFTRVFVPAATWSLQPGMVFHMYTSGGGMAFSETVLITEDGHERLTKCERALFVR